MYLLYIIATNSIFMKDRVNVVRFYSLHFLRSLGLSRPFAANIRHEGMFIYINMVVYIYIYIYIYKHGC